MRNSDWSSDVCFFRSVDDFAGYGWYDALPRALGYSFRIERGEGDVLDYSAETQLPPNLVPGRVDGITLDLAVQERGFSRSNGRRLGKGCFITFRFRLSRNIFKQKNNQI